MDPHFREYLAAVAGMQEVYGLSDDHSEVAEVDVRVGSSIDGLRAGGEAIPAGVACC